MHRERARWERARGSVEDARPPLRVERVQRCRRRWRCSEKDELGLERRQIGWDAHGSGVLIIGSCQSMLPRRHTDHALTLNFSPSCRPSVDVTQPELRSSAPTNPTPSPNQGGLLNSFDVARSEPIVQGLGLRSPHTLRVCALCVSLEHRAVAECFAADLPATPRLSLAPRCTGTAGRVLNTSMLRTLHS